MHLGAASEESDSGSVTPLRHSKECIETVCQALQQSGF